MRGTRAELVGVMSLVARAGRRRPEALGKRVFTREEPVGDRDLSAPGDAKFLSKHVAMRLRRSRRDAESLANFLIRAPSGDEFDDLALPLCDGRWNLSERLLHGRRR